MWEDATNAREQRKCIREMITDINCSSDQHSNFIDPANPFPVAADKLSDPTFECKLAFPFVGPLLPARFNYKAKNRRQHMWQYEGRTKFKELVQELKKVQKSCSYTEVWLYGTQGYGKSHLLAALVCYLAAQDERVVYIPDCWHLLRDPVHYLLPAMLFAWADDITTQEEIVTLNTEEEIKGFFRFHRNVIFVVDEVDALYTDRYATEARLYYWLIGITANSKSVFSTSANDKQFLEQSFKQNSFSVLYAYGGLTRVSHLKIHVTMKLLTRLDGNGPVVGAT